jgi:hypothetical protein
MKHKSGTYDVFIQKKGQQEAFIKGIKEGEPYYTVWIDNRGGIDTKNQEYAIILSTLIRIEQKLKKMDKRIDNIDK